MAIDDMAMLVAIEEIKQLKARYFLYLDLQDWATWASEVWAPDGELHVPEFRAAPFVGADAITRWSTEMMADRVSVHHGFMPIITQLSASEARGIWAMEDRIYTGDAGSLRIHGCGHYHETYVKLAGGWRISSSRLTRLRVERFD